MHHVAYVLLPKAEATTSEEARLKVYMTLTEDATFVGEDGRFFFPVCDWFVIGGRWSGQLYPEPFRDEFFRQANQLSPEEAKPGWYLEQFIDKYREKLDEIWQKLGGKAASPLTRDQFEDLGEDEDARLLDKPLADLLNTYLSDSEQYSKDCFHINWNEWELAPVVISLDYDRELLEVNDFHDLIGEYWVVVIDYHK